MKKMLLALLCLVSLSFSIYIPQTDPLLLLPSTISISPSPYAPKLVASRAVAEPGNKDSNFWIYAMKISSPSKSDIVALYQMDDGPNTYTRLGHYKVAGSPATIGFAGGYDVKYSGASHTEVALAAPLSTGKIAIGGRQMSMNSGTRPYLASISYSGGVFGSPSLLGVAHLPYGNGAISFLSSGNIIGSSSQDVLGAIDYGKGFAFVRDPSSSAQIEFNFSNYVSNAKLAAGNFAPYSGNEVALITLIPGEPTRTLSLLIPEASSLSRVNFAPATAKSGAEAAYGVLLPADIDGDGYDELLAAGSYDLEGTLYKADLLQAYDYGASGWSLLAECKNASTKDSSASAKALAFHDVDKDGKKEVVAVFVNAVKNGLVSVNVPTVNYYSYDASKKSLTLLASERLGALPEDGDNYQHYLSFAFGDFNGDGKLGIAAYYDEFKNGQGTPKLAVYAIDVPADTSPPALALVEPAASSAYNNSTLRIGFTYDDASQMLSGSPKVRIYSKQRDSGWITASKAFCSPLEPGCTTAYGNDISLASYPAGNYTIYAKANDSYGNAGFASKQFAILAMPAKSIIPGGLPVIPLLPNVTFPSSPQNEAQEEPEAGVQQEEGPGPEITETPPSPEPQAGQPDLPSSEPAFPGNFEAENALHKLDSLEGSVDYAKNKGADTSAAEDYLAKAQAAFDSGDYAQATMYSERGETLVEAALARIGSAPAPQPGAGTGRQPSSTSPAGEAAPPSSTAPAVGEQSSQSSIQAAQATDYAPYYVGVAAVVVLAVAYMFTHRPQPAAPEAKRKKK